ncbi:GNAT family N-acetyltransferase [Leptolyngbya sp. PL-A3]|nr:GNAT family N-acetyltransferase [Leptolyngbya sp. FACHB-8]
MLFLMMRGNLMVTPQPNLKTDRLLLRPFTLADAPLVQRFMEDGAIAHTARSIPYPYEDGMAEQWIATHAPDYEAGVAVVYAIALQNHTLIGAVGLTLSPADACAELGYWVGQPYWGQGYATEATQRLIQFGFESLMLNRIYATCLARNSASARVLQKSGMTYEGCLKQHVCHRGKLEDLEQYALLKQNYDIRSLV